MRTSIVGLAFLVAGLLPAALLADDVATPESQGVSSRGILSFVEACEKAFDGGKAGSVHGFVVRRHGKVIAEGTWAPDNTLERPHMLYSHSKSFTSTAVGFLVDDGKLDLDERIADIFADKMPTNPSPKMREVRVRDLLTMNVGANYTDAERRDPTGDWVKAFLANAVERDPGTGFKYDSAATFMLSAIVRRRTGKDLMAFLGERLFRPLGIADAWSGTSPDGTACGGWGMNMTTRDLAKFGQLYLDRGVWKGKRLLSEEWVALASARQTWSGPIGVTGEDGSDWHCGYGFQFWRCRHGAYRADGASGQLTVVIPDKDAVVSVHAGLGDMQKELNLIWDHLLPAMGPAALPEDPAAQAALKAKLASLVIPVLSGAGVTGLSLPFVGKTDGSQPFAFKSPRVEKTSGGWALVEGNRRLAVGDGAWATTRWKFSDSFVEPLFALTRTRDIAACGAWTAPDTLTVRWLMPGGIRYGSFRIALPTAAAGWITHPDMAGLKPRNVLARQLERKKLAPIDARHQNRHYLFRRSFDLDKVGKATLRITADDYYKLYVNGAFVAMGPAAGTTDCTYYNEIDLTPHLVKGRNTIAVHTYYQGLVNRVWVSGDNRHGLWLELDADGKRVLGSDASFKVARHTGYSAMGKVGYDTQFMECYDAGAPEVGFERPDFDDAAWIAAVRHPLGGDYRLVEQPSPMVVTEPIAPVRAERLAAGGLRIDFGGIYVGGVSLAASGRKGDAIGIRCGQELNDDGSVRYKLRANCTYDEKMVLSGGPRDVLNQYDYKSFRYLELQPSPGVTIDSASVRLIARHQPFVLKARPSFADPALKPVWDLCVKSFRYGVQEQIMDCMDREKGYYLGDGCYTMLAYCLLTQDWRQARKFFDDFLRTKKVDRGLVTCANCSFMQEIAEYPLMMMLFAHWYLEQTGDTAFVDGRFDALADVVDSYRERYARADGLLVNLDKWCVVEWPRNFQDGYDADVREGKVCTDVHNVINAWYMIAVRSLNAIARRLGRRPYADMRPLEKAFRTAFWDGRRHLFVDREGSSHVSLPGNVYAQAGRLAPSDDSASHAAFLALVKERGYSSISMFQFFPLFCHLRATGEEALLHDLLVSPEAWLRNLREGGTRTFEGWGRDTKWNTSLFHLTIASAAVFLTDVRLSLPEGLSNALR